MLETTWHTPTGWLTVQDLLVVGRTDDARRAGYRRPPGDEAALGLLLRLATCSSGRVEVEMNCLPLFEYGTAEGEWSYDGDGYRLAAVRSGELSLELSSSMQLGFVGARSYGRTTLEEGSSAFVALSWGGHAPVEQRRRVRPPAQHGAVLAQLVEHREVPRSPLPAVHRAQRARAEGAELRADGRDHGGGDDVAARDRGRRAELGLPLHVDQRLRLHVPRAARPRLRLGGVRVLRASSSRRSPAIP